MNERCDLREQLALPATASYCRSHPAEAASAKRAVKTMSGECKSTRPLLKPSGCYSMMPSDQADVQLGKTAKHGCGVIWTLLSILYWKWMVSSLVSYEPLAPLQAAQLKQACYCRRLDCTVAVQVGAISAQPGPGHSYRPTLHQTAAYSFSSCIFHKGRLHFLVSTCVPPPPTLHQTRRGLS